MSRRTLTCLVPSARVSLLAGAVLVRLTVAAAASVVSIDPGLRISAPPEPPIAWLAVASAHYEGARRSAHVWSTPFCGSGASSRANALVHAR
jgi:hypothetical protein